ncbi:hypothetical protein NHX12_016334 [Muraenolepis orangiensis]|uniref:HECT domain-containing protein n=1 Tax=Muraenolepis orangiensis TaxID=630683 RepID=A0A9Q0I2P4_9TELE|nr:hypothetical protein NHX12_016334 [Muraenolepis orangiensis]
MVKVTSFNANGLREYGRRQQALHVCEADIICLQETHWDDSVVKDVRREWLGDVFVSQGEIKARGVAILVRQGVVEGVRLVVNDDRGRLERSVRQGCPLSALLYSISAEPLAVLLNRNHGIRGIELPGGGVSLVYQYADDTTITVRDRESVGEVLESVREYGADSIPPLGFNRQPIMEFLHADEGNLRRFPEANTCEGILRLPLHTNYSLFEEYMESGIVQAPHFGLV